MWGAPRIRSGPQTPSAFDGQALARVKHGAYSLLLPGWSQWRSGHDRRALFFATAEVAVWGTWIFSELQANSREDNYIDFAQQFARVGSRDHADDYWRAMASFRDSDDFNADLRSEIRAGLQPDSALIPDDAAWRWQSERRFREFQRLRADALGAQDRADFVIVFALVNRVIAFIDAVRSGPPSSESGEFSTGETKPRSWTLDVRPNPTNPNARLAYRYRF